MRQTPVMIFINKLDRPCRDPFDLMDELDYYQKPKQKKGVDQKVIIGVALALVAVIGLLLSPVFATKNVAVEGAEHYTKEQLCDMIGLSGGDNIFLFGKGKAAQRLEQDPYIADAKLSMRVPDTIVIQVKERKVRGYVPYMGSYLYIDETGRVLDVQERGGADQHQLITSFGKEEATNRQSGFFYRKSVLHPLFREDRRYSSP